MYVDVVAVLATTSALDCARGRLSLSSPPEEEVMTGAMCAPAARGTAVSGCSKVSVKLILFIKFLMKELSEWRWGGGVDRGDLGGGGGTVQVVRGVVVLWWMFTVELQRPTVRE